MPAHIQLVDINENLQDFGSSRPLDLNYVNAKYAETSSTSLVDYERIYWDFNDTFISNASFIQYSKNAELYISNVQNGSHGYLKITSTQNNQKCRIFNVDSQAEYIDIHNELTIPQEPNKTKIIEIVFLNNEFHILNLSRTNRVLFESFVEPTTSLSPGQENQFYVNDNYFFIHDGVKWKRTPLHEF